MNQHDIYMKAALKEAYKAYQTGDIPVGCVVVHQGKIIARAHNMRHKTQTVFDHAEMLAIKKACKKLGTWLLEDTDIYVTLEPCLMCAGAILQSRVKNLIFATYEPKFGVCGSILNVFEGHLFNHQVTVTAGVLQEESSTLLKQFFQELRQIKKHQVVDKSTEK